MLQRGYEFASGYRLEEFLGRGQFGEVWRASAPGGTQTAVKFIDLSGGQGNKEYDAIKRIKLIRHANLMPITAIWLLDAAGKLIEDTPDQAVATMDVSELITPDRGSFAMPRTREPATLVVAMLLAGKSLLDRMVECLRETNTGIPARELLSYMEDSAKGLDFLNDTRHDLGSGEVAIQHCDVKPANIVILGNSAVICDFGLARILTRTQITATSASGTPAYMAPEAIEGKPSQSSDQYSLAISYYHLRTGTLPMKEGSLFQVLNAHREGDLNYDLVAAPEQQVLRRATKIDWNERYESNIDFVDELRDALRAEGAMTTAAGRPTSKFEPASPSGETQNDRFAETQGVESPLADTMDGTSVTETGFADTETAKSDGMQSTRALLLQTTDAGESSTAAATPSQSLGNPLTRHPLLGGVLAVVLLGVAIFAIPRGESITSNGDSHPVKPNPVVPPIPLVERSPQELLDLATSTFTTDSAKAAELFRQAVQKRPNLATPEPIVHKAHADGVETLLLASPTNQLISWGYDANVKVWPVSPKSWSEPSAEPIMLPGLDVSLSYRDAIQLSPDKQRLVAGSGMDANVWSLEALQRDASNPAKSLIAEIKSLEDEVKAVASHPKDATVVAMSLGTGKIVVYRVLTKTSETLAEPTKLTQLETVESISRLAFHPSGDWLVTITVKGQVVAYAWEDVLTGAEQNRAPTAIPINPKGTRVRTIAFPPQDSRGNTPPSIVTGDETGTVTIWSIANEPKLQSRKQPHAGGVMAMTISEGTNDTASVLVTGGDDGTLNSWTLSEGASQSTIGHDQTLPLSTQPVSCVDVTVDGRWVAAGTYDGTVWLLDRSSQDKTAAFLASGTETIDSICIDSANGWLIVGCGDGSLRVWDLVRCKLIAMTQLRPSKIIEMKTKQPPVI
ncbi:protein kinase domain-containing protein [Novipirellula sp. SH528]|uniref:protein kinase domain-containing protein n=1 Tax=Novipirellula sp. SH528 TaxID=3454466 RepID=UPI003F9F8BB5